MTVEATKAVWFECGECGHGQYADYDMERAWVNERAFYEDDIHCKECKLLNHVVLESASDRAPWD
jgi:hypothetical protein